MFTKKRVLIGILGIIATLIILFALTFIPRKIFKMDVDNISKITIRNGETGELIELTDKEQMNTIVENFNNITYQKKGFLPISGYSYQINIYNKKGKMTHYITVRGNSSITYKMFHYKSRKSELDLTYIDSLFKD